MIRDFTVTVPANSIIRMIHDLSPDECEKALMEAMVRAFQIYCVDSLTNDDIYDICTEKITDVCTDEEFESTVKFGGKSYEKNLS